MEHGKRPGNVLIGTACTEFESISTPGDGSGSVTILHSSGNTRDAGDKRQEAIALSVDIIEVVVTIGDVLELFLKLSTHAERDDCRRGFVGTKTVIVTSCGNTAPKEISMDANGTKDSGSEGDKALAISSRLAEHEKVVASIGIETPVEMLSGTVDSFEGFLVEEDEQIMLVGKIAHDLHR